MSGTVNKVVLIGNTGDDVKMHYFENGNCVGRFPLATSETYTNRNGERVTTTEWHNIIVRNKAAEICEKYLKKGDMIYVEGRIKTRKWQDESGMDRYSTEIQCTDFTFLTPKSASGANRLDGNSSSGPEVPKTEAPNAEAPDGNDKKEKDDLPF